MDFSIFFYLVPLVVALFIGLIGGWMAGPQTGWEVYRASDWLGFLIAYGTLGGTQIIMGAPSFSIAVALIAIVNVPHLTATGIVDKSPVAQVAQLFGTQVYSMEASIVISMILGLIVAGLIAFFRSLFGIREMPPPHDVSDFSA